MAVQYGGAQGGQCRAAVSWLAAPHHRSQLSADANRISNGRICYIEKVATK